MAYTPLTTQIAGGIASAAGWANLVKGNFEAMWHLKARKPTTESLTSNVTLQNDDDLKITVPANEQLGFRFIVIYDGAAAGDLKVAFTFPTGGDLQAMGIGPDSLDITAAAVGRFSSATSPTSSTIFGCNAANDWLTLTIEGSYINGGTAGDLQLQWAQATSNATATRVKANSTAWGIKLA